MIGRIGNINEYQSSVNSHALLIRWGPFLAASVPVNVKIEQSACMQMKGTYDSIALNWWKTSKLAVTGQVLCNSIKQVRQCTSRVTKWYTENKVAKNVVLKPRFWIMFRKQQCHRIVYFYLPLVLWESKDDRCSSKWFQSFALSSSFRSLSALIYLR